MASANTMLRTFTATAGTSPKPSLMLLLNSGVAMHFILSESILGIPALLSAVGNGPPPSSVQAFRNTGEERGPLELMASATSRICGEKQSQMSFAGIYV